jgi:predicted metalloprotease with PDZ domain
VTPKHYLDMVADRPEDLEIGQAHIDALRQVVRQAGEMFQSRHYDIYRMLVSLSDNLSGEAVDHQQSLDNRRPAKFLTDPVMWDRYGNFLAHDYVHSWNGKYRRPVGLSTPNLQVPVDTTSLWIYEGLTQYLSAVVTVRAGIWTQQQFIAHLAADAARMEHRTGRQWRDLQDTSSMAYTLWANSRPAYDNWRRDGFDFYAEGALIWLDVEATIRKETHGRKTLDDFLTRFFGSRGNSGPAVAPYPMEDLVADLQAILPYDWKTFFDRRLQAHESNTVLGGLGRSGYRLVYRDTPDSSTMPRRGPGPRVLGRNGDPSERSDR